MPSALKFREVPVGASHWTPLSGAWLQTGPVIQHQGTTPPNSFNFFVNEYSFRDGAVEATLRVSSSQSPTGRLLFRRTPRGCYYAGIGGYSAHFVIAKFIDAEFERVSVRLATAGSANDIRVDEPYELRVEFVGEHIVLKSGGVPVLEATDTWFSDGNIGVNCYGNSVVEFLHFRAFEVPPVSTLVQILETFPYVLKRDYRYRKHALQDEADVQRILWTMLRSHYADLVDEEVLGKFGLKHYKNNFGIPSLATIIEVKIIREGANCSRLRGSFFRATSWRTTWRNGRSNE